MTIMLTTHYLEEADELASRLAILDGGRVVAEGTPDELKAELRGDSIQLEIADPDGVDLTSVGSIAGVVDVTVEGRLVRARADDGAAAIARLIAVLEERNTRVASATVSRPSLDDVYLRHAGRAFREADSDGTAEVAA
jgi:ABC-2 type transport system ATP-binding protein